MRWKKSLLVIRKIQRVFVNTLTADGKHYLLNRGNLTQPIQMQLNQKKETSSELFFAFSKSMSNLYTEPKKSDPNS